MRYTRLVPGAVLLAGSTGWGLWSVRGAGDTAIGGWGLIECLPPSYWLCVLVPMAVFAVQLRRRAPSAFLLSAALVAQVLLLHGAAAAAESVPRFVTAWLHAGFTDQIMANGSTLSTVDGRFCWPGFFSTAAAFSAAVGVEPIALLRWAPVFFVLAYLPPLALLTRSLRDSPVLMWVSLWFFVATNWVGQDYFAPQSFGYLVFLIVLSVVCRVFAGHRSVAAGQPGSRACWGGRLPALLSSRSTPPPPGECPGSAARATLLALVVALCAVLAMSHQLTPFILSAVLAALALIGALRVRLLPIVAVLLTVGWVVYAADAFWRGHLDMIFETSGKVRSILQSRLVGSSAHQWVLYARMGFTALIWAAAGTALLRAARRRHLSLPVAAMLVVPFSMLAIQSYGGEGVLRVFLFALPATSILVAELVADLARAGRVRLVATSLCLAATVPAFFVARYGNESFERFKPGEVAAVSALYEVAPPGSTLVSLTPNVPWRYREFSAYEYEPTALDEFALDNPDLIIELMAGNPRGGYLIVTAGQRSHARHSYGLPAGWAEQVRADIEATGKFDVVYRGEDGVVYRLVEGGGANS